MNTHQLGKATNKAQEKYMDLSKSLCPEYSRSLVQLERKPENKHHIGKTTNFYEAKQVVLDQITLCDKKLWAILNSNIPTDKKHKKLAYWQNQRTDSIIKLTILVSQYVFLNNQPIIYDDTIRKYANLGNR